jgi:hypothetical protein
MAKVTIYLPDGLAERVKALDLSVSPVCQGALQEEVDKLAAMKNATRDIEKVAARLRETMEGDEVESRNQGFLDGTDWARDVAMMSDLRRVAGTARDYERLQLPMDPCLADYIPQLWDQRFRSDERWTGWDVHSEAYMEGFIDAAATVYHGVVPLL